MNLGQIISRVQKQFGDEAEVQLTKADIINFANDGQLDIARHTQCLEESVETNSVASQKSYVLPNNFLGVRRVTFDGVPVQEISLEDLDEIASKRESSYPTGAPQYFYIWSKQITFFPAPTTAGTGNIEIMYYRTPAVLSVDTDVPEIPLAWHEDIVRFALSRAKELDEETVDSQVIWEDYKSRVVFSKDELKVPVSDSYPSVRLVAGDE